MNIKRFKKFVAFFLVVTIMFTEVNFNVVTYMISGYEEKTEIKAVVVY